MLYRHAVNRALDEELAPHVHLCEVRGVCCDFRSADHRLYASELEVRYALRLREARGEPVPRTDDPLLCPFWRGGLCTARDERPLGCRTYFCAPSWRERGEALHEHYHRKLQGITEDEGIPYRYGPWVEGLAERLHRHGGQS